MAPSATKTCPTCNGRKIIDGDCVCDSEWRGTQSDDGFIDCQCAPNEACPTCGGTGQVADD